MSTRILRGARILTLNPQNPVASTLAIAQGRILAAGQEEPILAAYGNSASIHNLDGLFVLPGLTDAHIHLQHYALNLQKIDCEVPTKAECLKRVEERARNASPGSWILGHGWDHNYWTDGFGTAADLDAIAPHNPVYLTAKSLHASWINSRAMEAAGIDIHTTDPVDGKILRFENGQPTGTLLEGASALVAAVIPEPSLPEVEAAIQQAIPRLWEMGITGVHDFDGAQCFEALQNLHFVGDLKLRVLKSIPLENLSSAIAVGLRSGFGDDWLRIGGVKIFMDGALGPQTAAMLQAYDNSTNNSGMLFISSETLLETGKQAIEHGISLAIHAIGDRANRAALDALELLRRSEHSSQGAQSPSLLRHRLEHVQILHPKDLPRLAELGVIASVQPIHATSDMLVADRYLGRRARYAYAWRSLLEHNTLLAFGSDAPVDKPNPFAGLYAAVTRRREDGFPGREGWHPEQRLPIAEALHGFTTGPAWAAGMENHVGRLAPGFLADLLILDRSPLDCSPGELKDLKPLATMVGGEWVYWNL